MRIVCALILVFLFISAPLLAQPTGKPPEAAASLDQLKSQAQKIKAGTTTEAEVIALMGQPSSVKTKDKLRLDKGLTEKKILFYGPNKNIRIPIEKGVVTTVEIK